MAYTTKDYRGEAAPGIRVRNADEKTLQSELQSAVADRLASEGIPASVTVDTVRSGGLLFGTRLPIIVITHPNPPSRFFSIGVVVNGNMISFPLLGESKQNTAANQGRRYDEFKLQQEVSWQASVTDAIDSLFV